MEARTWSHGTGHGSYREHFPVSTNVAASMQEMYHVDSFYHLLASGAALPPVPRLKMSVKHHFPSPRSSD